MDKQVWPFQSPIRREQPQKAKPAYPWRPLYRWSYPITELLPGVRNHLSRQNDYLETRQR